MKKMERPKHIKLARFFFGLLSLHFLLILFPDRCMAETDLRWLSTANISIDPEKDHIIPGKKVTFNSGDFTADLNDASNVKVLVLIDTKPIYTTAPSLYKVGGKYNVKFTWEANIEPGHHWIHFIIDPEHISGDINYNNNGIKREIFVGSQPDLRFTNLPITIKPIDPMIGDSIQFETKFLTTLIPAQNVKIRGGVDESCLIDTTYEYVESNHHYPINFTWAATLPGSHKAWLELDPEHSSGDVDYSNNRIETVFNVDDGKFDIWTSNDSIVIKPENITNGAITSFLVNFGYKRGTLDGLVVSYGIDSTKLGEKSYKEGDSNYLFFNWIAVPGTHKVWAQFDPLHTTGDTNYNNNWAEKTFEVSSEGSLDLMFIKGISTYPDPPVIGQSARFSTVFTLEGPKQSTVTVAYGIDDSKLGEQTFTNIDASSYATPLRTYVSFDSLISSGTHKAWFELDPQKQSADIDYNNNQVEIQFGSSDMSADIKLDKNKTTIQGLEKDQIHRKPLATIPTAPAITPGTRQRPDITVFGAPKIAGKKVQWGRSIKLNSSTDKLKKVDGFCEVPVDYVIYNSGTDAANTFRINWNVSGVVFVTRNLSSLTSNMKRNEKDTFMVKPGRNMIKLKLDDLNQLKESNEANNEFKLTIELTGDCGGISNLPIKRKIPVLPIKPSESKRTLIK
ncbi:MAG: hypothetical protein IE887_07625 [Campylobacterales bacterium]|nr:hypothetical protein [Campylobacterales bacterium]